MEWKDMTTLEKVAFVFSCVAAVVVIISKIKPDLFPIDPTYPGIAVFTALEAVIYWKQKRKLAYLLIGAAVISIGCYILGFFLA